MQFSPLPGTTILCLKEWLSCVLCQKQGAKWHNTRWIHPLLIRIIIPSQGLLPHLKITSNLKCFPRVFWRDTILGLKFNCPPFFFFAFPWECKSSWNSKKGSRKVEAYSSILPIGNEVEELLASQWPTANTVTCIEAKLQCNNENCFCIFILLIPSFWVRQCYQTS